MKPSIVLVGVGGAGCSYIAEVSSRFQREITTIGVDSNERSLSRANVDQRILLGKNLTHGRGTGGHADVAYLLAKDSETEIRGLIGTADLLVITSGFGRGMGTGAVSAIVEMASTMGILCLGVFSTPFSFEGKRRQRLSNEAIEKIALSINSYITLNSDDIIKHESDLNANDAFSRTGITIQCLLGSILEVILKTGVINADFGDLVTLLRNGRRCWIDNSIGDSVNDLINQVTAKLIKITTRKASGILVNIEADESLPLQEVGLGMAGLADVTSEDSVFKMGYVVNKEIGPSKKLFFVATGL